MATKPLKSIQFPGLSDTYTVPQVDNTLAVAGDAADAKKTGDEISELKQELNQLEPGLSSTAKAALLACFRHVAFLDDDANYYGALESALYADDYPRISAVFNPGSNVIYTDDALNSLKQYLTVTYYETVESVGVTLDSADYTLSGILVEGTNTVYVAYGSLVTSFAVDDVVDFYDIWTWSMQSDNLQKVSASVDPNQSDTTKYPSRITINPNNGRRRAFVVSHGKAPFYIYESTEIASSYYPVPVPSGANHIKITMTPTGQYIYCHFVTLNEETGEYSDSIDGNKKTWTQLTNGVLEWDITPYDNMFFAMNSKYDSSGTSYPVEPTGMTIEFSEV